MRRPYAACFAGLLVLLREVRWVSRHGVRMQYAPRYEVQIQRDHPYTQGSPRNLKLRLGQVIPARNVTVQIYGFARTSAGIARSLPPRNRGTRRPACGSQVSLVLSAVLQKGVGLCARVIYKPSYSAHAADN